MMQDGLYRVVTRYLCAGFVIKDGIVSRAAPVLWNRIGYWVTVAERVGD